jgi:hypothetical protein
MTAVVVREERVDQHHRRDAGERGVVTGRFVPGLDQVDVPDHGERIVRVGDR